MQIIWANRLVGDAKDRCLVTVDGTHFLINNKRIQITKKLTKRWFSHKFNKAGVSYEIAVCIKTGDIVWINGPFPAGTHDLTIFRYKLKDMLLPMEHAMGDRGHRGYTKTITPCHARNCQHKRSMAVLRSRHEAVNRRFKTFKALDNRFRHDVNEHHIFFRSAAVLIQLGHQLGYSHFDVVGHVDPSYEAGWV